MPALSATEPISKSVITFVPGLKNQPITAPKASASSCAKVLNAPRSRFGEIQFVNLCVAVLVGIVVGYADVARCLEKDLAVQGVHDLEAYERVVLSPESVCAIRGHLHIEEEHVVDLEHPGEGLSVGRGDAGVVLDDLSARTDCRFAGSTTFISVLSKKLFVRTDCISSQSGPLPMMLIRRI